jgi:hypothetical protein
LESCWEGNNISKDDSKSSNNTTPNNSGSSKLKLPMLTQTADSYNGISLYPAVTKYVEIYADQKRNLLLKDNHLGHAFSVAKDVVETLSEAKPPLIPKPKITVLNCASKNSNELFDEVKYESLTSCSLLLHDISNRNKYFLGMFIKKLLKDKSIFVVATLKQGEEKRLFIKGIQSMFEVIDLPEPTKDIDVSEEGQEVETITHEPRQEESKDDYIFRRDCERWYIKFENEVLKPENLDGFGFMYYLMACNKSRITPEKLYKAVKGVNRAVKDEGESLKTYSVESKTIEKAQLGELKEIHTNSEMLQFANELKIMNKNEIKRIVAILKREKESLINKKSELEEEGRFSESDGIEKEIKDTQEKIDLTTRQEHNPEHKQFYDLVYKAIEKAKEKIKNLSAKEDYNALLTWNHFKDSIIYNDFHYFYNPTAPIDWEL